MPVLGQVGDLLRPVRSLTTRGRSVLAGGVAAIGCALVLGQRDLLRVGVLLAILPLLAALVAARTRYRLSCTRTVTPARVPAGRPARVVLELANLAPRPSAVMLAEERLPYVLGSRPRFVLPTLAPGERRAVSYTVRGELRGRFALGPLSMTVTDPFGMTEVSRSFSARDELVVTPAIHQLPHVPLRGDWSGSGDARPHAVGAVGEDDVVTREYRIGDDLRRIHWRSTARRGELMVRREEQPWQSRAVVVLDRRRDAHRGEGAASSFEWAVSAAASVAVHLIGRGYAVRLADGRPAHDWSTSTDRGTTPLLDSLAVVDTDRRQVLEEACLDVRRLGTGLVVAVVGSLAEEDVATLARTRAPGTSGIALLADTASYVAAGGADPRRLATVSAALERAHAHLGAGGWLVATAPARSDLADVWRRATTGSGAGVVSGAAR